MGLFSDASYQHPIPSLANSKGALPEEARLLRREICLTAEG
jgi:hypothetical protein